MEGGANRPSGNGEEVRMVVVVEQADCQRVSLDVNVMVGEISLSIDAEGF